MSKPRGDPSCGTSSEDVLIPTERHPAYRQREARSGSGTERENLRNSDEGPVMGLERRRWVIAADVGQLVRREEPFVQWKAAAFVRWHEPDHARVSCPDLCGLRLASALKSAVCDDGRGKA
jgi:hypothetical protein